MRTKSGWWCLHRPNSFRSCKNMSTTFGLCAANRPSPRPLDRLMKPPEEKLYDYQAEGVDKFAAWVQNTHPEAPSEALISLAMGMGKTRTAASCIRLLLTPIKPNAKTLWLTHREELIEQSKQELEAHTGEYCEIEKARHRPTGRAK